MSLRLGRYETIRAVASGGMATVHLARALGAGGFERLVAIKVLHPHIQSEPDFVAMFLDEARLAAQVRHPNVVPTIDVSTDPLFLVMEYVEGPSLHAVQRELRRQKKVVPIEVALRITLDLLAGLHAAHELTDSSGTLLSFVHRDVSPHNILLGVDGVTRITDFGVARAESRLSSTRGGQVKGKLAYMAPEQVRAAAVDRRSDVYAAGVVLHELLTNQPLFSADNDAALVSIVAAGASAPPSGKNEEVPAAIDEVCVKALSTDPALRYATAADFSDALDEAARTAGLHPASTKAVSAFIKLLAIHDSPNSAKGEGSRSKPASEPAGEPGRATPVTLSELRKGLEPEASDPAPAETMSSTSGVAKLVLPQDEIVLPKRTIRWQYPVAAAAALVVGGALLLRRSPEPTPSAGSASPSAVVTQQVPVASSSIPTPSATATASVVASASAPIGKGSASPSAATMLTGPMPSGTAGKSTPSAPPPSLTNKPFRPGGL
jgi:eukaryotic-like serine/threonine-protein kinase